MANSCGISPHREALESATSKIASWEPSNGGPGARARAPVGV